MTEHASPTMLSARNFIIIYESTAVSHPCVKEHEWGVEGDLLSWIKAGLLSTFEQQDRATNNMLCALK